MTAPRPRVLVTGITGLLGSALARAGSDGYDVHGLARHPEAAVLTCALHRADITDAAAVQKVMDLVDPDLVIHAAAIASVNACEADVAAAVAVNVAGTANVTEAAGSRRLVFISTDSVFDGRRGHYTERDAPAPIHVYARTKLDAEQQLLDARPDALAIRTSFYGWNVLPRESLSEWILNLLKARRSVQGFTDVRFSPLLNDQLARLLYALAGTPARGVLHVGSRDGISKWDFARRLATVFGHEPDDVVPLSVDAADLRPSRPKDVTLDVSRAAAVLGERLPSVDEGIEELRATTPRGGA